MASLPGVHVVATFGNRARGGLPFQSGVARLIYARHVLEHVEDLVAAMEEIHRVAAPGAQVTISVPYFTCVGAFADPTHRHFFTYDTFCHFAPVPAAPYDGLRPELETKPANPSDHRRNCVSAWEAHRHVWLTERRFRVRHRWLRFGRLHQWLGIEWWANRHPRLYENFLPYLFPARELEVELEVTVPSSAAH